MEEEFSKAIEVIKKDGFCPTDLYLLSLKRDDLLNLIDKHLIENNDFDLTEDLKNKIIVSTVSSILMFTDAIQLDTSDISKLVSYIKKFGNAESIDFDFWNDTIIGRLGFENTLEFLSKILYDQTRNKVSRYKLYYEKIGLVCSVYGTEKAEKKMLEKLISMHIDIDLISKIEQDEYDIMLRCLSCDLLQNLYDSLNNTEKEKLDYFKKFYYSGSVLARRGVRESSLKNSLKFKMCGSSFLKSVKNVVKHPSSVIDGSLFLMVALVGALAFNTLYPLGKALKNCIELNINYDQIVESIGEDVNGNAIFSHSQWKPVKNEKGYFIEFNGINDSNNEINNYVVGYKIDKELFDELIKFVDIEYTYDSDGNIIGETYNTDGKWSSLDQQNEIYKKIKDLTDTSKPEYVKILNKTDNQKDSEM